MADYVVVNAVLIQIQIPVHIIKAHQHRFAIRASTAAGYAQITRETKVPEQFFTSTRKVFALSSCPNYSMTALREIYNLNCMTM